MAISIGAALRGSAARLPRSGGRIEEVLQIEPSAAEIDAFDIPIGGHVGERVRAQDHEVRDRALLDPSERALPQPVRRAARR